MSIFSSNLNRKTLPSRVLLRTCSSTTTVFVPRVVSRFKNIVSLSQHNRLVSHRITSLDSSRCPSNNPSKSGRGVPVTTHSSLSRRRRLARRLRSPTPQLPHRVPSLFRPPTPSLLMTTGRPTSDNHLSSTRRSQVTTIVSLSEGKSAQPSNQHNAEVSRLSLPTNIEPAELGHMLTLHLADYSQIKDVKAIRDGKGGVCAFLACEVRASSDSK